MMGPSRQAPEFVAQVGTMGMGNNNDRKERILGLIRKADSPLSVKQISDGVPGSPGKKQVELIQNDLLDLKITGQVFEFPPDRARGSSRFGHVSPVNWLGTRIVRMVEKAGGRLTLKQARSNLSKWETKYFDQAIGRLVKEERLFYLTVRYKYVVSSRPDPFDHLLPRQVTALREVLERINRHRKRALPLDNLKAFLNGADLSGVSVNGKPGQPTEELLREWYHKDLPRRGGLPSIPIAWTWDRYESWCLSNSLKSDLNLFREFIQSLYQAGRIEFFAHSMTQQLSERDLKLSLKSPTGEILFYWRWR
jgi:hypothetical protein